ncbi:MAG: hypothetical protein JNL13_07585 [Chitinophagaceae bacterium]|nr:hypothetical protein [Chitinophagaceae bacterium]
MRQSCSPAALCRFFIGTAERQAGVSTARKAIGLCSGAPMKQKQASTLLYR